MSTDLWWKHETLKQIFCNNLLYIVVNYYRENFTVDIDDKIKIIYTKILFIKKSYLYKFYIFSDTVT